MKRYRLGITLFLSLLLHLGLLYLLWQKNSLGFKKGVGEHRIKASFKEISNWDSQRSAPIKTPPAKSKQTAQKSTPTKTQQQEKKEDKKEKEQKNELKPKEIQESKTIDPTPQEPIDEPTPSPQESKEPIANPMEQTQGDSQQEQPALDFTQSLAYQFADASTKKNISEFYGPEFGYLGKEEQEYIINNLAYIGRITQKYLRYPANAAMLQQGGGNVVEFYLHPNGDISDLKIIKKSGFLLLDRNSIKTIEIAYKDYPHPKTKTLIRFYINYFIRYR